MDFNCECCLRAACLVSRSGMYTWPVLRPLLYTLLLPPLLPPPPLLVTPQRVWCGLQNREAGGGKIIHEVSSFISTAQLAEDFYFCFYCIAVNYIKTT